MRFPIIESIFIYLGHRDTPGHIFLVKYPITKKVRVKKWTKMAKIGSLDGLQSLERRFWEKFYMQILKGVSVYKGRLLYAGIGACAYKRGTILIYNFTNH